MKTFTILLLLVFLCRTDAPADTGPADRSFLVSTYASSPLFDSMDRMAGAALRNDSTYLAAKDPAEGIVRYMPDRSAERHEHTTGTEPLFTQLRNVLRSPYFTLGLLAKVGADFHFDTPPDGRNGFFIGATRISLSGALDHGFGYRLVSDITRQPVILDARLSYDFLRNARLNAGLYKPPFSHEFLMSSGALDFVTRSQAVVLLVPGRQIGMSFDGRSLNGLFNVSLGMFNGNDSRLAGNDNNRFMYAGRIAVTPRIAPSPADVMVVGLNALYNDVRQGNVHDILLYGGDFRLELAPVLLSAEAIQRNLRMPNDQSRSDFGYHVTAGVWLTPDHQVLARWDSFLPEDPAQDSNFIILGSNFWPTTPFKFQFNYLIPADEPEFENHRVLFNFQLFF